MHVGFRLGSLRLAQKGEHDDHDQQGFKGFAQQDREGAEEARRCRGLMGVEGLFGIAEQTIQRFGSRVHLFHAGIARDGGPQLAHRTSNPYHQLVVVGRQKRFDGLEAVGVSRQGEIGGSMAITLFIGNDRFVKPRSRQRERRIRYGRRCLEAAPACPPHLSAGGVQRAPAVEIRCDERNVSCSEEVKGPHVLIYPLLGDRFAA